MRLSLTLFFILLFSALLISNNQNNSHSVSNKYLLHAESSERLLSIMQQISSLAHGENIEEPIKLTEDDTTDLIEAVEELLFYGELMAIKVPSSELEESKGVIFSAMASQLYDEALNIQQLTKNYNFQIINYSQENILNEAFVRLSRTCNACHQLFRDN